MQTDFRHLQVENCLNIGSRDVCYVRNLTIATCTQMRGLKSASTTLFHFPNARDLRIVTVTVCHLCYLVSVYNVTVSVVSGLFLLPLCVCVIA